jgi:16S rRNA processing protein RimM
VSTWSWRSSPTTERLVVARVTGAKGLTGTLRIEVLTDWPEHLDPGSVVFLEGEDHARRIAAVERGGRIPAIRLDDVTTRDAADALVGRYLEAEAEPLPGDTFYWHEIEGMAVVDESGAGIGTVEEVFRAGGAEVYRIKRSDGSELLIAGIRDVVRQIDPDARRMVIRVPDELVG